MTGYLKPLPEIDAGNEDFWKGAREHRFLLYQCQTCKTYYYPAIACTTCEELAPPMEWVVAKARESMPESSMSTARRWIMNSS